LDKPLLSETPCLRHNSSGEGCLIRRSDDDLFSTPEHQLDRLSQDELLRMVVIGRDSQDAHRRRLFQLAWKTLVTLDFDRIRGLVAIFRFSGQANVKVDRQDVDHVASKAWERAYKMKFKGSVMPEYRAAMRTCVRHACEDHCRSEMTHDKRRAGSLDEEITDDEGSSRRRFDADIAKREKERIDEEEDLERALEMQERLREAIGRLDGNRRRVLEMTLERRSTQEIAAALDTSADNVYQLRRRALGDIDGFLNGNGPD
jgi:RNA polymerase sigma factor (sigma-70 family)